MVVLMAEHGTAIADARARAYEAVGKVSWPGMYYRTDIAAQGVS